MLSRSVVALACLTVAAPAIAEPLKPEAARRFVAGKTFAYNCFDGTRGVGRINADGSVVGTIQIRGAGPTRYASLPPNTLRVRGEAVCASLRGMPFEPCFNVDKTAENSFRGSISGLGFAYCDFTRRAAPRARVIRTTSAAPAPRAAQTPAAPAASAASVTSELRGATE